MIQKEEDDYFYLYCDNCGEQVEERFVLFLDAVEFKKYNGWKSVKNRSTEEWHELCPECANNNSVYRKFAGIKRVGFDD